MVEQRWHNFEARHRPVSMQVDSWGRWGGFLLILALVVVAFAGYIGEAYWDYRVASVVILGFGLFTWAVAGNLATVPTIGFAALFYPALGPFAGYIVVGQPVFSGWNVDLQLNQHLTNKILHLFMLGAGAYCLSVWAGYHKKVRNYPVTNREQLSIGASTLLAAIFLVCCYLMEPEASILTATYSDIRPEGGDNIGALASQLLILVWALLFAGARHHKKLFNTVTLLGFVYLVLHGRRSETLGMVLVYMVFYRSYLSNRMLVSLVLSAFLLFGSIEYVRDSSLKEFSLSRVQQHLEGKMRLPGASNVMITAYDIVELKDEGYLKEGDKFTFDTWLVRLIPTPIVNAIGLKDSYLEGTIINRSHLGYIGGMHSLAIMYLNGGVILVLLWGVILGRFSPALDRAVITGTLMNYKALVSIVFLIVMFRFHWYHPIGFVKQLFYIGIVYLLLYTLQVSNSTKQRITHEKKC